MKKRRISTKIPVFQLAYTIDGTGKFALTYEGNSNEGIEEKKDDDGKITGYSGNGARILAYFNLSMIENLGIDIGFGYTLPSKVPGASYNAPIAAGLGVAYNAGEFGVKARVQGRFAEKMENMKGPLIVDFDVLPSYAVSDTLSVLFDLGVQFTKPDSGDSAIGWHVEPYVAVKSSAWAPNFYAGIRVESDGVKGSSGSGDASKIDWSVPIGIWVSF